MNTAPETPVPTIPNRVCVCGKNIDERPKSYRQCKSCEMTVKQRNYNKRIGTTRRTRSSGRVLAVIG